MPRTAALSDLRVDHLSILGEDGQADEDLAPDIPAEALLKGYRAMLLARRFDERRLKLQRAGEIGTFAPVNGQEAAQIGTISALREDDWFVPSFRETAANIWRGTPLADMLMFDAGYNEGVDIPKSARNLPNAVPVATQMLHATGIAHAARLEGSDEVVMTYFGDGATSEGDFHEALNFASVFDCPVIFVCQNNQYAISTPRARQTHSRTLAQKAIAYDMDGIQVDGNDLFACYVAASQAARRAREEHRPTLIECVTYRLEMHTTADDPTRYREEEEVSKWKRKDPIVRFRSYLEGRDLLDDAGEQDIETEITEAIDEAVEELHRRADNSGKAEDMFSHVFRKPTPELKRQCELMAQGKGPEVLPHV